LGPRFGVILHYQDPKNYYVAYRQTGGSSLLKLSKIVNGVETVLKSKAISNPPKNVFFRLSIRRVNNTLHMDYNGVDQFGGVIDTTFTSGGVGVWVGQTRNGWSHRIDNFVAK
jgi:hypothetical protein